MVSVLLLIVGFVLLIKGGDFLIKGASALALKLHIPQIVIGLTVVAFGTSAAELFINIFASIEGKFDIAVGNVLGSNIFNVLVILGVAALLQPLTITRNTVWKEIPFSIFAAVIFILLANDQWTGRDAMSVISRIDGIILLSFFLIFIFYVIKVTLEYQMSTEAPENIPHTFGEIIFYHILGFGGLIIGGKLVVHAAVALAQMFHVSESLIALTIVAAGTSLPELSTTILAAARKNSDIAVGNVIGSNIFNIFLIIGISALINPIPYKVASNFDAIVGLGAVLLAFVFLLVRKNKIYARIEGIIFLCCYILYVAVLLQRG